jgi:hypothetical protein
MADGDKILIPIDSLILRAEYEKRHEALEQRIVGMEGKIDATRSDIVNLTIMIQKQRATGWQFVAITLLNFCLSGGILGVLSLTGHFH